LVRPEPGNGVVIDRVAGDRLGDGRRLIVGVLDRFEPDVCAIGKAIGVERAIADREDIGQVGAALRIDRDAVAAFGPGIDQRLDGGDDADADDHHFGRQHLAIGQLHARGAIVLPDDAVDLGTQPDVDAVRAMLFLVEARQRLAGDAREHAIERFEHGDLFAELGEDSGRLEPDIAAADHDGAGDILHLGHHAIGIGAGADGVDAGQIVARADQATGRAAGRPDQMAVGNGLAVVGEHPMGLRIDGDDTATDEHRHLTFRPESRRADQDAFERLVAGEIVLAERGAFVRQFGLVADDRDRAGELLLAQRDGCLGAAMAGANDQNVVMGHNSICHPREGGDP
jgi:hypothetical protein